MIITIILIVSALFVIWFIKGVRESYVLKDKLIYILVSKYGLSRQEAIMLIDDNHHFVFEMDRLKLSPIEIASRLYVLF